MTTFNTVTFGSYTFPDVQDWNESLDTRVDETEIPRRHGALIADSNYVGTRQITFRGTLYNTSTTNLRTDMALLQSSINALVGTRQLQFMSDRYINAVKKSSSFTYPTGTGFYVADWQVSFVCGDPFYYDTSASINTSSNVSASWGTKTISYTGSAPAPLRLAIKSLGSNPTGLTIYQEVSGATVAYFVYSKALTTNDILDVNASDFTILFNGVSATTPFVGDFFTLQYTPGSASLNNVFRLRSAANCDIGSHYTNRYF